MFTNEFRKIDTLGQAAMKQDTKSYEAIGVVMLQYTNIAKIEAVQYLSCFISAKHALYIIL